MNQTKSHRLLTSFRTWLDYKLCKNLEAYREVTMDLYDYDDPKFYTYEVLAGTDYQWIYDSSVGVSIPSGISHDGGTINRGDGGMRIDFDNGRIISDGGSNTGLSNPTIDVAVKEINTFIVTESVENLINKMNFDIKPSLETPDGYLAPEQIITPCIFINLANKENESLCFGGMDEQKYLVRCTAFVDEYQAIGLQDTLTNSFREYFPIMDASDSPIDEFGDLKSPPFNFETVRASATYDNNAKRGYIKKCIYNSYENDKFSENNPSLRLAIVDFHISDV